MVSSIGANGHAIAGEDGEVVFGVVANLEDGGVFQHRLQARDRRLQRYLGQIAGRLQAEPVPAPWPNGI